MPKFVNVIKANVCIYGPQGSGHTCYFVILLLVGVFIVACDSKNYSLENPDEFCKKLLAQADTLELREWLYDGVSTLSELQTNKRSIAFIEKPYKLGARIIYGVDIEEHPKYGKNSGDLVVELPESTEKRNALIEWAAPIAWKQGFDAYSDVGQRYLYVKLD